MPTTAAEGPSALADFLADAVPHSGHQIPLTRRVTAALWGVAGLVTAYAGWLAAVLVRLLHPGGPLYRLAAMDGHPRLAGGVALVALAGLGFAAARTRAFTRASLPALVTATAAGVAGLMTVAGAVLAVALVVIGVALTILVAVAVLSFLFSPN